MRRLLLLLVGLSMLLATPAEAGRFRRKGALTAPQIAAQRKAETRPAADTGEVLTRAAQRDVPLWALPAAPAVAETVTFLIAWAEHAPVRSRLFALARTAALIPLSSRGSPAAWSELAQAAVLRLAAAWERDPVRRTQIDRATSVADVILVVGVDARTPRIEDRALSLLEDGLSVSAHALAASAVQKQMAQTRTASLGNSLAVTHGAFVAARRAAMSRHETRTPRISPARMRVVFMVDTR